MWFEDVAERVWLRKVGRIRSGEFGGWLEGHENRVFQQAQARRGTAGTSFTYVGASLHPASVLSHTN